MTDVVTPEHLESVRRRFTELGTAMAEVSRQNADMFEATVSALRSGFSETVEEITDNESFEATAKLVGVSKSYAEDVSTAYAGIPEKMGKSFGELNKTIDDAEKSYEKLSGEAATLVNQSEQLNLRAQEGDKDKSAKGGVKGAGRAAVGMAAGGLSKTVISEVNSLKGWVTSSLSSLKIPMPGNILGGLVDIMVHGYMDKDRVRAEAGEMKNILIAAYDDGVKGAVASGTRSLAAIGESMQRFMGINRSEIQAVAQSFVDGGISVTRIEEHVAMKIRGVENNTTTVALALDKMLNIPSGSSAKRMVGMMRDYGKSLEDARDLTIRMQMVGKQSGIGAKQFAQDVDSTSNILREYGFDIEGTIDLLDHLRESFEGIGVPKQFAGRQAALGMQQIASGIVKMSDTWKVVLGEKLTGKRGLEARQAMMDAFLRVLEEKNTHELVRYTGAIWETAMEAAGGNEATALTFVDVTMGFGFVGAKSIKQIHDDAKAGRMVEAAKAAEENIKLFRKTFDIEKEKMSQFDLFMNTWMKGLAKVGTGLLGLTANTLAMLIAYFKALPEYIGNIIDKKPDANIALAARLHDFDVVASTHTSKMIKGFDQMMKALSKIEGDVLGASLRSLQAAWTFDPTGGLMGGFEGSSGGGVDLGGGLWQPTQATVRPVMMPAMGVAQPSTRTIMNMSMDVPKSKRTGGRWRGDWVGGGVSLEVGGVDTQGNLSFSISGNCPRCGFVFGGVAPQSESAYAEGETVFQGVGTGGAQEHVVDFGEEGAMDKFREATMSRKVRNRLQATGKQAPKLDRRLGDVMQMLESKFGKGSVKVWKTAGADEKEHGKGRAMDVQVQGAPAKDVYKFLRSEGFGKTHGGLGYYPATDFVHVDVRDKPATWVDLAQKGQRERVAPEGGSKAWLQEHQML
jgi:hypothetical protein